MSDSDAAGPFPFVVCLGASAGGLEALEAFFQSLPAPVGVPFVVITHLSPDFKSLMPELLAKHTELPVQAAKDGAELEADNVYIIPAAKNMVLRGRRIDLQSQDRRPGHALNLPIDLFLESMATEFRERSMAVILSGTGSDGSRGVRYVKEAGGVVFAQEPASAKFDGMPRSALVTGLVDKTGTPQWLAERIAYLTGHYTAPAIQVQDSDGQEDLSEVEPAIDSILTKLQENIHLDLSYLRRRMVQRRVHRRMVILGLANFEEYYRYLSEDVEELAQLSRDLLIGVTRFFRDEEAFETLRTKVIPELILSTPENQAVRIWVSACSTGNEAYSLLILFLEAMRSTGAERSLKMFATDVDQQALERASKGVYSMSEVIDVPMHLLTRYFDKQGDEYVVRDVLRQNVIFARHNLVNDPPFTKMHFLSCRNLLIYLKPAARLKVLDSLVSSLQIDQGILFLGSAETPVISDNSLASVDARAKIYRRTGFRPAVTAFRDAFHDPSDSLRAISHQRAPGKGNVAKTEVALLRNVLEASFEAEDKSAVVIDGDNRVIEVLTDPLTVFRLPKGKPSNELARICPSGLLAAVTTAQQQLKRGDKASDFLAVGSAPGGGDLRVSLLPLRTSGAASDDPNRLAVLTLSLAAPTAQSDDDLQTINPESAERVAALEAELRQTKESLQATIEELQSSSEEQQSTNEELIASNEELQSTNQELLSVNEELYTVNSEYHKKNEELKLLTTDLDNLLNSTEVATLYLDANQRVRKFTQSISRVLPLQASDIGRPIADLANQLDTDFVANVEQVLETDRSMEREVRDRGKAWVLMRITPYRGPEGRDYGVLVTFVDVTRIKNAEETARVMSERLVASNQKLTAQSEQLEDLFSIVAHDLKRPVVGLDGSLKIVQASLESRDIDAAKRHVDSALGASVSLASMLKDLGEVSKLRQLDVPLESISINSWIQRLLEPFIKKAEANGVQFGWACDHGEFRFARLAADGIITNLVENALVHGVSGKSPRIDVTVQVDSDRLRISVSDNGPGIAREHHERIFELFRRLHPGEKKGTGVGLVAAQRFAERADGLIQVFSDVGQGAKFVAELPLYGTDSDNSLARLPDPILLVDDDAIDGKRVRILLERYPLRWAKTLSEGIEEVVTRRFSLIILDLSLPDGHGFSLTASTANYNRNTPVIILSGQLDGLMPNALDAAMVDSVFSKEQIESTEFRQAVEHAMSKSRGRAAHANLAR